MRSTLFGCLFAPQVRTLFVSGLPIDVKPRELYLLFRGYKVSRTNVVCLRSGGFLCVM